MHLQARNSAMRWMRWIPLLLVCGAGSAAWGQFSNAYSGAPQKVQDQDAALSLARQQMLSDVSSLAMPDMLQAANHGDAAAMRNLACVYWDGLLGHAADADWGLQWFERAAVAGNVEALSMIGDHYATGADGKPNFDLAKLWYGKGYAANDARSTVGLAEMSCQGSGATRDIVQCGKLLDQASSFMKPSDAADTKPMVAESMFEVAGDYHSGIGIAENQTLAAAWYAKSADLGRPSAAFALSKLYIEPGGLATNLTKATAVLDAYMKQAGSAWYPSFSDSDRQSFADTYVEIGAAYEKLGVAQLANSAVVYREAANMGYPDAIITLGLRYAQGTGVTQDLAMARTLLTGWNLCVREDQAEWNRYNDAVGTFNALVAAKHVSTPIRFMPCPMAAAETTEPDVAPPTPVQPRYPNMIAPDTVTPQQKFPLMVSLNTTKFDAGTKIVSAANQQDGQLMLSLPQGMTSILIAVNVVAPQMTSVDGVSTQNIELTVNQDSTTAVFQMQAGSAPGVEPIFATLTYNGAFLATIRRDVTVGAVMMADARAATVTSAPPPLISAPPPAQPAVAPTPAPATPNAAASNSTAAAPMLLTTAAPPIAALPAEKLTVAPRAVGIRLEPEARAPDITIQEIQSGTSIIYTVTSPLLPGFEKSTEIGVAARQAIVTKLYNDLEAQGNALDQIGGAAASQKAKDYAEGQGATLYDNEAPAAFKSVYQKLEKLGAPPLTIEVLTDDPSLPWELMRPTGVDGKREGFLGLRVSVVHSTASSTPLSPPPTAESLDKIEVVMPKYTGDLALAGAQTELKAMQVSFPALEQVTGNVTDVSSLARDLPDGIVHFAGHGVMVTTKGLPPDVGILLTDGTIIPSTWMNLAERGSGHPFYFFNACDLGVATGVLDYVDGWAPKLLQSGASGYLGALWKVSDTTASSFSGHFYADLKVKLAGTTPWSVADIVTQARKETYAEASDPTALAYVLYSAPYQTLANGTATTGASH